jgi:hypothetical protein
VHWIWKISFRKSFIIHRVINKFLTYISVHFTIQLTELWVTLCLTIDWRLHVTYDLLRNKAVSVNTAERCYTLFTLRVYGDLQVSLWINPFEQRQRSSFICESFAYNIRDYAWSYCNIFTWIINNWNESHAVYFFFLANKQNKYKNSCI